MHSPIHSQASSFGTGPGCGKSLARLAAFIGMTFALVAPAWGGGFNLGGSVFAIEGEYLYVADIGLPVEVGDTFENCYTFQEDLTPGDSLDSGVWDDPLFPSPGPPIPGTWIQHAKNQTTPYTALADDGNGLTLVQRGNVIPVFGKRPVRLKAYSTVSVAGLGVVIEVLSSGHLVEDCPFQVP